MSEPFIAEIRVFSFNYAPRGWAKCDGQLLPIAQNQALFSVLGTIYGGNGQTNFALPNLKGRTPIHFSGQIPIGQVGGEEVHTLTQLEMPAHIHAVSASNGAPDQGSPANNYLGTFAADQVYAPGNSANSQMGGTTAISGGSQPHNNMQPYLVLNICIALQGTFPSRN